MKGSLPKVNLDNIKAILTAVTSAMGSKIGWIKDKGTGIKEKEHLREFKIVNPLKPERQDENISNYQRAATHPYLNLKDKLSQIWINQYTLLLVLIAIKVFLFQLSLKSAIIRAESYTKSSCTLLNNYASKVVSMPHYSAKAANVMIAKGVQETNDALVKGLQLLLTGVEAMIMFYIQLMVGTYACLLTAAIDTSVDVATNASESVISWVNNTLEGVTDTIEDGLTDLSKFVNTAETAGESIIDLFTSKDNDDDSPFDKVNLTVSSLKSLRIPASINQKLESLSQKTPDFDTVENKTKSLINIPFKYLKNELENDTLFLASSNNMKVPTMRDVQFCPTEEKIHKIYVSVGDDLQTALKVILCLVVITAVLVIIPLTYLEYRQWKRTSETMNEISQLKEYSSQAEVYAIIDKNQNRIPTLISSLIVKVFRLSSKSKDNEVRWVTSYSLSPQSVTLLGIAMAGILAVVLQSTILFVASKSLQKGQTEFKQLLSTKFDMLISKAANDWANSTNMYLDDTQSSINKKMFGMVVNATDSVNNTITKFYDGINEDLEKVFNNTAFEKPVKAVVKCIIGNKVESVEKALTWVHDNAIIILPRVNSSYLLGDSSNSTNFTSDSSGSTSSLSPSVKLTVAQAKLMLEDSIKEIIKEYKKSLMIELTISLVLLGIFLFQVLIAWFIHWLKTKGLFSNDDGFDNKLSDSEKSTDPPPLPPIRTQSTTHFDILHNDNVNFHSYPAPQPSFLNLFSNISSNSSARSKIYKSENSFPIEFRETDTAYLKKPDTIFARQRGTFLVALGSADTLYDDKRSLDSQKSILSTFRSGKGDAEDGKNNEKFGLEENVQIILSPPKKYRKVGMYANPFEDEIL